MSSGNRATSRGSKGGKGEHVTTNAKPLKSDSKTETAKTIDNPKAQPTPEQMRIAQIIDGRVEDPQLKEKIKQVMDATHKSEMEACAALHDSDYDANRAVNMLFEGHISTEWETRSKKKKNRQPSTTAKVDASAPRGISSDVVETENWDDDTPTKPSVPTDPQRTRPQRGAGGAGAPRMRGRGSQDNRGWRGRENKENERNLEDSRGAGAAGGDREQYQRDGFRRGGGASRGGRMSNGARGGSRTGPRSFSNRGGPARGGVPFPRATPWNPDEDRADAKSTDNFPPAEDWDNEEYTGSLSDTKVFTPSNVGGESSDSVGSLTVNNTSSDPSLTSPQGVNSTNLNYAQSAAGGGNLSAVQTQYLRQLPDNKLPSSNVLSGGLNSIPGSLTNSPDSKTATRGMTPSTPSSGMTYNSYAASAAHSVAGSVPASASYPSTYSSVSASVPSASSSDTTFTPSSSVGSNFSTYPTGQSQPASYTATATSYSTVYGSHQDGSTQASGAQPLPARPKTQRPRVPPPSKIPQSAVEMPGDGVNNIGLLDVQFGGLDFGTDAFDSNSSEPQPSPQSNQSSKAANQSSPMAKYSAGASTGMDSGPGSQPVMDLDAFTAANQKAAALTQTLKETLMQAQSQQAQAGAQPQSNDLKSQPTSFNQQSRGPGVGVVGPSALDNLVKSDQSSVGNGNASASGTGAAGSMSYSAPSSNYQSSYTSQKSVGSGYQSSGYNPSSYSSQAGSGVSASSSNAYPANYPSNVSNQGYQNVQSVYGGSGGNSGASGGVSSGSVVGSSSGYTASSNAGVYQNSYGTSAPSSTSTNKLTSALNVAKDLPQYDTTATSSSNLSGPISSSTSGAPGLSVPNVSGSVNNSQSLGLQGTTSLPSASNTGSTKVTNSSAKNVVQNMPPGVPPIIAAAGTQYIMSQGGLQYFQQPAVYSYEEQQILPLRLPHVPAGYYDISFQQAPTSLATGREGSLANVPYSMSDARFARTDNASPVPSSLSQQNATQAHQQPMMNAAGFPPGYAAYAYYGGSVLPANYQYGTPAAMYPVAPATNAHGNTNSTQYAKPGSYGSSYGSGYEGLTTSQDYSKGGGGYAGGHSGTQNANKAGVGTNAPSTGSSATDLYNKSHVTLSKVNSYDKGFHSGTPPPFNLPGNQNAGMAPSGAFPTPLYIPPPMHQPHHQSTTLMQHPVHQMDMRNTSRRSDTGNNSGQRSQSSTQTNKTGSKQVYSQNYWAN